MISLKFYTFTNKNIFYALNDLRWAMWRANTSLEDSKGRQNREKYSNQFDSPKISFMNGTHPKRSFSRYISIVFMRFWVRIPEWGIVMYNKFMQWKLYVWRPQEVHVTCLYIGYLRIKLLL